MSASRSELQPRSLANNVLASAALSAFARLAGYSLEERPVTTSTMPKKKGRQGRHVQSNAANGMNPVNKSDLSIKPPTSYNVPSTIPRNVASLIAWDTVKLDFSTTVTTSAITEFNESFSLNNHPQVASWTALFDQWCIPQVSICYRSLIPPGGTNAPCIMYTALDFDNNSNLGSIAAIEDFASCQVHTMGDGAVVMRSIRPCSKVNAPAGASDLARSWHDSGFPGVSHTGFRAICSTSGASYVITRTITIWYAFRNQI